MEREKHSTTTFATMAAPAGRDQKPRATTTRRTLPNEGGRLRSAATMFICGSVACGGMEPGSDEAGAEADGMATLDTGRQALGNHADWVLRWPTGVVPYCYQPSAPVSGFPQPGTTAFNETVQLTDDAVAKYEAIPDAFIDFQGGELCEDWDDYMVGTDPGTLRIVVTNGAAAMRFCGEESIALGEGIDDVCEGTRLNDEIVIVFGRNFWAPEAGILHELGHALGFNHEYWRRGGDEDDCDPEATTEASPGITAYDVYSVLNATYCHTRQVLSPLDQVGLAFVYPGPDAERLFLPLSFELPSGILTSAANNAQVRFALHAAGVEDQHYAGVQWARATPSGYTSVATGSLTLGTALGAASQAGIRGRFTDSFGRVRTSPTTTIIRNPSLVAAIIDSVTL